MKIEIIEDETYVPVKLAAKLACFESRFPLYRRWNNGDNAIRKFKKDGRIVCQLSEVLRFREKHRSLEKLS